MYSTLHFTQLNLPQIRWQVTFLHECLFFYILGKENWQFWFKKTKILIWKQLSDFPWKFNFTDQLKGNNKLPGTTKFILNSYWILRNGILKHITRHLKYKIITLILCHWWQYSKEGCYYFSVLQPCLHLLGTSVSTISRSFKGTADPLFSWIHMRCVRFKVFE